MGGPLNEEEAHVIQGVLDLSSKTGSKAMTPLDKVLPARGPATPRGRSDGSCCVHSLGRGVHARAREVCRPYAELNGSKAVMLRSKLSAG